MDAHDEITGRLVRTFSVKLIEDINSRIEATDPQGWTPDDLVMRGRGLLSRPHYAANRHEALKLFEQAFESDPSSVGAKYGVANVLMSNALDGWSCLLSRTRCEPNNCSPKFSAMTQAMPMLAPTWGHFVVHKGV